MRIDKLFRPYQNNRPVTTKWYRTEAEAKSNAESFLPRGTKFNIVSKDINALVQNRKKTGFRGLF